MGFYFIEELIAVKVSEKVELKFDVSEHLKRLRELEQEMESAFQKSTLPEKPNREPINDLLVQLRLETLAD